ncbi:PaaI family thioesterase [Microbacterium sp. No. 7]|uniref:PaaI family thioesterase n=1 Tax=Microbacterium sp. No. 7 TaxID=1714373 RepID=UPI0006D1B8AB|nr:hotdog fold thioesterase [Microbacterium sp. No. 7]ALJ21399.1 hypothetical protein AOA12_16450 [Microbacterium sp. No. 7]
MSAVDEGVVEAMFGEPSLAWFGFDVIEASGGCATVRVTPTEEQANGTGFTHGGVVFALADQTFAAAAISVLGRSVTADAMIQYLSPSKPGVLLTAVARTTFHDDRRAVIDVDVLMEERTIAVYRGTARAVRRN